MGPEYEYRLIVALGLYPGATARELGVHLDWPAARTSARLGEMHYMAVVQRERIPAIERPREGRIEYRYWLASHNAEHRRQHLETEGLKELEALA